MCETIPHTCTVQCMRCIPKGMRYNVLGTLFQSIKIYCIIEEEENETAPVWHEEIGRCAEGLGFFSAVQCCLLRAKPTPSNQ